MGPHGERENIFDPGGVRTQNLRNRLPLLYQLSYKASTECTLLELQTEEDLERYTVLQNFKTVLSNNSVQTNLNPLNININLIRS